MPKRTSTRHADVKKPKAPNSKSRVVKPATARRSLPDPIPALRFREKLMPWYREHARSLPWRGIHDPYATWLSEIMLQQTRVATVIDRYGEFLHRFPTLQALADAPEDDVLALWSGLGYYRRARMLHRGAQFVVRELNGHLPRTSSELRTLPGVGEYTAAAVASIAFGESIAVVDGNVERVLLRILGQPEDRSATGKAQIAATAQSLVPAAAADKDSVSENEPLASNPPGDHNQAMMELGATICLPREPLCLHCPVVSLCRTRGEHRTQPRGQQQSRTVAHLLAVRKHGRVTEVLLERRPEEASLMPGMLELPPLPVSVVAGREPVLRLRHSITNTNYMVQIFSEGAPGQTSPEGPSEWGSDEEVFEAGGQGNEASQPSGPSMVGQIPAAQADLVWAPMSRLRELPLTGLARKCLQRLRLMAADIRPRRR
jgi:A/G-specific adenine glycosylase